VTLRIFVRITWLLVVLGGAALFVAVERFDLIKLQEAQCYLSDSAATAPIDKFVQTYLGRSIRAFPSDKYLESIFADNPQLERAELRKHYDGRLTIALRVKKPVLLVSLDQIYGLTSRGELIPAGLTDLPIVTGLQISAPILYTFAYSEASAYALKIAA